jgi:hypothetical protein
MAIRSKASPYSSYQNTLRNRMPKLSIAGQHMGLPSGRPAREALGMEWGSRVGERRGLYRASERKGFLTWKMYLMGKPLLITHSDVRKTKRLRKKNDCDADFFNFLIILSCGLRSGCCNQRCLARSGAFFVEIGHHLEWQQTHQECD